MDNREKWCLFFMIFSLGLLLMEIQRKSCERLGFDYNFITCVEGE